jgi:uncharacterized protein YvpB
MKKIFYTLLLLVFLGLVFLVVNFGWKEKGSTQRGVVDSISPSSEVKEFDEIERSKVAQEVIREEDFVNSNTEEKDESSKKDKLDNPLPTSVKIDVPFTSQAPYGLWDERHEEACEEASLIMLVKYLKGESLTIEVAEKEIQDLIDFQIKTRGNYKDTSVQETKKIAEDFYELDNLEVIYDFEKEKIKEELSKRNPIIIPAAGKLLGNPYFTPPGPLYHNLLLVGYDGKNVITHDPGTRRGENYVYDIDNLYEAIHDFTGKKEDIEKGRRAMIVVGD